MAGGDRAGNLKAKEINTQMQGRGPGTSSAKRGGFNGPAVGNAHGNAANSGGINRATKKSRNQ